MQNVENEYLFTNRNTKEILQNFGKLYYTTVLIFFIFLQTRYPHLNDPEKLRPYIDEFLEKVHLTDAILLYAPSQVRRNIFNEI